MWVEVNSAIKKFTTAERQVNEVVITIEWWNKKQYVNGNQSWNDAVWVNKNQDEMRYLWSSIKNHFLYHFLPLLMIHPLCLSERRKLARRFFNNQGMRHRRRICRNDDGWVTAPRAGEREELLIRFHPRQTQLWNSLSLASHRIMVHLEDESKTNE